VARVHRQRQPRGACTLLAEPPLIDKGEVTDKGSINQRAVLRTARAGARPVRRPASDPFLILPNKA
jgi:feruloyl-CoA synthase